MSMLFKRIKDWATSITAFRTGDYIAVDGTSGTAKMAKDDLLKVTAENALNSNNLSTEHIGNLDAEIKILDDNDDVILKITDEGLDAKSLKQNGNEIQEKFNQIDESVSGLGESVKFSSDDGTDEYCEITDEGVSAKDFIGLNGKRVSGLDIEVYPFNHSVFDAELKKTIDTINNLKSASQKPFVLGIITDTHHQYEQATRTRQRTYSMFRNFIEVCRGCGANGAIHLGDILDGDKNYWNSNNVINKEISFTKNVLHLASENAYMVLGNHDGINGSVADVSEGYDFTIDSVITRCYVNNKPKPYYYFVNTSLKIIGLCLAVPYTDEDRTLAVCWDFDQDQLDFFANALSTIGNDYHAFVFCHEHEYTSEMMNNALLISFCNVLDAFTTHTAYSDSNVSVDFTGYTTTKTVAWVSGHWHMDAIYYKNDWVSTKGRFSGGTTVQNTHEFPIVVSTMSGYNYEDEAVVTIGGHDVGVIPKRRTSGIIVDAFDTMVYQKDLGKLTFVRFGSSATNYQVDAEGDRPVTI